MAGPKVIGHRPPVR